MWPLLVFAFIATASAQIPSLGWCPDYQPMANFNMNRFLGSWYEAERYFTVSELGSRCIATNYVATPEGRILVSNEITNYITGMKRVMEGSLQMIGREGEGRIMVKYSSLPIPYDYEYSILDTDYDSFAVMWSCSGLGPVHTQSAWLLTRERLASPQIMQSAYAVLDRFKISRAFFVKTSQADCTVLPDPAADPAAGKSSGLLEQPEKPAEQKPEELAERKPEPEIKADLASSDKVAIVDTKQQEPKSKMSEMNAEPEKKEEKMEEIEKPDPPKMEMPEMAEKLKASEPETPTLS